MEDSYRRNRCVVGIGVATTYRCGKRAVRAFHTRKNAG